MSFSDSLEWMVEIDKARKIFERAVDLGINFFDTANVYSKGRSEEILGEHVQGRGGDTVITKRV